MRRFDGSGRARRFSGVLLLVGAAAAPAQAQEISQWRRSTVTLRDRAGVATERKSPGELPPLPVRVQERTPNMLLCFRDAGGREACVSEYDVVTANLASSAPPQQASPPPSRPRGHVQPSGMGMGGGR